MKITLDVTKRTVAFVFIILFLIIFSLYKYLSFPAEPVKAFDFSTLLNEKEVDEYLESILVANKSINIVNNKGFHKLVDSLNFKIIEEYSQKLELTKDESKRLLNAYYESRSKIITDIHTTMISNKHHNQKREITYEYLNSLNGFSESFSGFACGVASFSYLSSLSKISQSGFIKYMAIKPSCASILTELVNPATSFLRDKAIIKDMNIVTLTLKERVKASVFKLATAQETLNFELDNVEKREYDPFGKTKFLGLGKLEWTKKSELNAYVEASVIAGFDMSSFSMEVRHETRTLLIYLPSPKILFNNVSIYFRKANKEWGAPKIDSSTYNKISKKAKIEAYNEAKRSNLYKDARNSAYIAVMNIFEPLMELPQFKYKVKIYFNHEPYAQSVE